MNKQTSKHRVTIMMPEEGKGHKKDDVLKQENRAKIARLN